MIGRAALRELVRASLRLWAVDAVVDWQGDDLCVRSAGQVVHIAAGTPPFRWTLSADGRRRPCLSITGLLNALRDKFCDVATRPPRVSALPALPSGSAADEAGRIPVLIVTGALGSGKTTLLSTMLRNPGFAGAAVIVNEFGAVGLDHALLESSTETLVELPSGCLCCAVRGDLQQTMLDLERRRSNGTAAFERVVIETSGLADPAPILHAIATDSGLAARYAVRGIVTLVDAVHGNDALTGLVEAQRQVALASRVLITKTDLQPASDALRSSIAAVNADAIVAEGTVSPEWMLTPGRLPAPPAEVAHTPGIGSVVIRPGLIAAAALALFLQALADQAGPRLLRVKGLVALAEAPARPALVQAVRHAIAPLSLLDDWPEPDCDGFLVVIGDGIPPRWPELLLRAIAAEAAEVTARQTQSLPHCKEMTMTDTRQNTGLGRRDLARLSAGIALGLSRPSIARAEGDVLRIVNIQPTTGPSAAYGWRARDGAQLAADEINAAGLEIGGKRYRIELPVQDMSNDPQQAITLLRQAASDASVMGVIGPSNSVGFIPCVPAAGQLSIALIGAGSGAPVKEWNKWAYRVNPVSGTAIPALLQKIHAKIGFKRLAVIYDATQDGQSGDAQVCKAQAGKLGYEVVAFEAFRAGDQDFSAQLATIRVSRPDALFVAAATGDGVKVATQVRELGIKAPMMTGFGSFQDPVYWDGTRGVIQGSYTWLAQDLASPTPAVKKFMDAYKAKYNQEATSFATYGADAVASIAAAAQKAGSVSRAALQEALSSLDVTNPLGTHITFNNPPTGENQTPTGVVIEITGRGTYSVV